MTAVRRLLSGDHPVGDRRRGRRGGAVTFPPFCDGRACNTEDWFAAARVVGLGANLEMAAIHNALPALSDLPDDVTLAISASSGAVVEKLLEVACSLPDRGRPVVEITEHEYCAARSGFLLTGGLNRCPGMRTLRCGDEPPHHGG
ncbi:hypothetical protein [Frankia sp. R82]|uniref:hypothetical protein n=1 Tax=Frankia sp. R82 TaxID=2950553 RepID=UPI0020433485|nr:hypothetical protein [Frankia sp. R82]MCM3886587.1 hypothetical protein [Frankia sp. R82]